MSNDNDKNETTKGDNRKTFIKNHPFTDFTFLDYILYSMILFA